MKIKIHKTYMIVLLMLLLPAFFEACNTGSDHSTSALNSRDDDQVTELEKIRSRGKLIVVADYNSTNYFIYRGQPMGYQYQMLQELADYLDLRLEVRVSHDLEQSFMALNHGDIDLIAMNLTVTADRKKRVDFTYPHSQTRQVLVQKMPDNYKKLNPLQVEDSLIRNQLDLAGKSVHVQKGSVFAERLKTLSNEIGAEINIIEVPIEAEQLVHMVARGEIEYTVSDENVALVNKSYYPVLDVQTAISFPQNLAWALRKGSDELKDEINSWLVDFRKTSRYAVIYNKYYKNHLSVNIVSSDYYVLGSGKISRFDDVVKRESERIGWDWRLVSSMIYQESRFNPNAISWAGAFGLMQLMPATAGRFGVSRKSSPESQIRAGVSFIKWLDKRFQDEIIDPNERAKFVLAAYNVGKGHVDDARRLAEKYGDDPDVWDDSVEKWLLNKSEPQYFRDPVVKYGYARGIETTNYVVQVLDRYEHYRNIVDEELLANNQSIP
ncbi:MAG: transporter substrate-binding domain-containing protein [Bacteroidales bacterium]|nr:transporter substrate-binding domain-containing protein [Bacteroidales bacterium]